MRHPTIIQNALLQSRVQTPPFTKKLEKLLDHPFELYKMFEASCLLDLSRLRLTMVRIFSDVIYLFDRIPGRYIWFRQFQ
jgi:hypothetical protein